MSDLTKHTTAQVVAALSKHHDWTAEAPLTDCWIHMRARVLRASVRFEFFGAGIRVNNAPFRDDWTIRRADGSIVKRKPRRERVRLGPITRKRSNDTWGAGKLRGYCRALPDGNYDIYAVEK
jgi:hypothetical protein